MDTVAVFLKYPTPGRVKTRLAGEIGYRRAAHIYSAMALGVLRSVTVAAHCRVFFDPPAMEDEVREWTTGVFSGPFSPQVGNSLGERMANAVEQCIDSSRGKVVVIGTDCPDITPTIISEAFGALDTVDVVIGPCDDGGYYLIGMREKHRGLFNGIEWSTDRVMAQTVEKARGLRLNVSVMETLRDIDCADDLNPQVLEKVNGRAPE